MTTNFRFNDKRTWYTAVRKDNIKKIADNIPKETESQVIKFWSEWLHDKSDQTQKQNQNTCKYADTCPLFQPKGHTCNDESEASEYCGKHREFDSSL